MNGSNEIYDKKRETQKRREEKEPKKNKLIANMMQRKKVSCMPRVLLLNWHLLVFPTIELNKRKKKVFSYKIPAQDGHQLHV